MPLSEHEVAELYRKLDAVKDILAGCHTAVEILKKDVVYLGKDIEKHAGDIENLYNEIKDIHETRVSKREFDNFKEDMYKPLKDAVDSATKKILIWTGIGIVAVWLLGFGGDKLLKVMLDDRSDPRHERSIK